MVAASKSAAKRRGSSNSIGNQWKDLAKPKATPKEATKKRLPSQIRAAAKELDRVIEWTVSLKDVKGSTVGDPLRCAGARGLCNLPLVEWAWVLKTVTYLGYKDGTIVRGMNSTKLTQAVESFDRAAGLFPPGVYRIYPAPTSSTLATMRPRERERSRKRRDTSHATTGKIPYKQRKWASIR